MADKSKTTEDQGVVENPVPVGDEDINEPRNKTYYSTDSAQIARLEDQDKALDYLREENLTVTERIDRAKAVESEEAHRDGGPRQPVLEEVNRIREKYRGQY